MKNFAAIHMDRGQD